MLTPEAAPGVGAPTLRRTASAASALPSPAYARTADDVEDGDAEAASARSAPAQDMSAAIAALLLPVYVPRAILSTGSGLCVVARRVRRALPGSRPCLRCRMMLRRR